MHVRTGDRVRQGIELDNKFQQKINQNKKTSKEMKVDRGPKWKESKEKEFTARNVVARGYFCL